MNVRMLKAVRTKTKDTVTLGVQRREQIPETHW